MSHPMAVTGNPMRLMRTPKKVNLAITSRCNLRPPVEITKK